MGNRHGMPRVRVLPDGVTAAHPKENVPGRTEMPLVLARVQGGFMQAPSCGRGRRTKASSSRTQDRPQGSRQPPPARWRGTPLAWLPATRSLFRMLTISLFIDERLTFSFFAIEAIPGLTSMVLRSILLSRSRSICSARSNGRLGGLPLGRPVARCFMFYSLSPHRA